MVVKYTVTEIPVMTILFLRFALSSLLLLPFLLSIDRSQHSIRINHLGTLVLSGLFLIVFNNAFGYTGVSMTTAINASSLTMIVPVVSVLAGWMIFRERIFLINLMGVFSGLAGALVIIGLPLLFLGNFSTTNLLGNLLIILSSVSFVAGAVFIKELSKEYHPLVLTSIVFMIGAMAFFVPALLDYLNNPGWVNKLSVLGVLGILYITVLATVCSYILVNWGLSKVGMGQATLFQYLEPAITASLAVPLLGERISYSFIVGTCLIVLGVYWGTLGRQEHHHTHHKSHRL